MKNRVGLYRVTNKDHILTDDSFYTIKLNNGLYIDIHPYEGGCVIEVDREFPTPFVYKAVKVI